jgi:hypothetical protein
MTRTVEIATSTAIKPVRGSFMSHSERMARFAQISATLALQSNQQLTRLVDEAEPLATGIGGTTLAFDIDGVRIFAKRVRLTDLERRPEHWMSTANLFELRRVARGGRQRDDDRLGACAAVGELSHDVPLARVGGRGRARRRACAR